MKTRAQELLQIGDALFSSRVSILSLWQATAEQFYPERADYTYSRSMGMEFASHLMTGSAVMASRDLANSVSAMLRPPGQSWFHPTTSVDAVNRDTTAKGWLDWAGERMRKAMYDNRSGFTRATKEGDRDFVTIGQCVLSIEPNRTLDGLLFRCWHPRDVAWSDDANGNTDTVHRKWKVSARALQKLWPDKVAEAVKTTAAKDPNAQISCRHIVVPADEYDLGPQRGRKKPFVSIHIDVDNQTILEEIGVWELGYVIPRWATVPGQQYAYSPATVVSIADARMLQQITLTLLEAGQKAVDPPYKAVGEAIQGGVNTYAGGITWVDAEYDEKTGRALEPLLGTMPNLGWGVDREEKIRKIIADGHFLSQISMPDTSGDKTAFEIQKLWEEYVRKTTPLFEPIQTEYNGVMCDRTFTLMLRAGAFGAPQSIPKILQGQEVLFTFETPLQVAASRANVQAFTQLGQIFELAVQMDPGVAHDVDVDTAFRDAVDGTGAPAKWLVPKEVADQAKAAAAQQAAQQNAMAQTMQTVGAGADTAAKVGNAATLLAQGGVIPPPAKQVQQGGAM